MQWYDGTELDLSAMTPQELMETASMSIGFLPYEEIADYPDFMQHMLYLVNFDCDLNMEGILTCLENSCGTYFPQIIRAFRAIGAEEDASILEEICRLAPPEQVREEFLSHDHSEYAVTTFAEDHDWMDEEIEQIEQLAEGLYTETGLDIWKLLEEYLASALNEYH